MATRPIRIGTDSPRGQWRKLAASILLVMLVGALGALASVDAPAFYASLTKPRWAPPAGVFGPVWTLLYLMIGTAAWLVWRARGRLSRASGAMVPYGLQLALNALWSFLFFHGHHGALALIEVCALWFAILVTLVQFWRVQPAAGILLLPYLAWVSFATALTAATWHLNPGIL
jgi:translocator protein